MKKLLHILCTAILALTFVSVKAQTMGLLYGMNSVAGDSGGGTIYSYDVLASKDSVVYPFAATSLSPEGSPIQANDGNFYGLTSAGVFKITPAGKYSLIAAFNIYNAASVVVYNSLIQGKDGNLYGMTTGGGTLRYGSIFKCTTSGVLTTLVSFNGTNGSKPYGSLIQGLDGNLYGVTSQGGASGDGNIFKCTTSGILTSLVSFNVTNGSTPYGGLCQASDSSLYGMTAYGGASNDGTIFKCTPSGTLTTLVSFNGLNGKTPYGSLIFGLDSNLYGTTTYGGTSNVGSIFKCTTSGTITTLVNFNNTNGANPYGCLLQLADSSLYGMTPGGGTTSSGVIFKCSASGILKTFSLSNAGPDSGCYPYGNLILATDGYLYGLTSQGGRGTFGATTGTLFKYDTAGSINAVYNFGYIANGNTPESGLIQGPDGYLYGMTSLGGTYSNGTIFKISPSGVFTTLVQFDVANGDRPYGRLLLASDGNFYGMALGGSGTGLGGYGIIFKMTPSGTISTIYHFSNVSGGNYPSGSLVMGSDGNIYGTTPNGGTYGYGVIFECTLSGSVTTVYNFQGATDGEYPRGSLVSANDGNLYGMTNGSGSTNYGGIFQYNPWTNTFAPIVVFNGTNGGNPYGSLIQASDGNLYGMTIDGGTGSGNLFKCTTGGVLTNLVTLDINKGTGPYGDLIQASDGNLYGTTASAGNGNNYNQGTLFQYKISSNTFKDLVYWTGDNKGGSTGYNSNLLEVTSIKALGWNVCGGNDSASVKVRGGSPPYTYLWSNGATTSSIHNINSAGKYTVTVTNSQYITLKDSVVLSINTPPTVTVTSSPTSNVVCKGSPVTLSGNGAVSYSWSGGITNGVAFSPASTATYTVTGTDGNGCVNTNTVTVTVNSLPTVTINASPSNSICTGSNVTLSGSGASSYAWSTGVTNGVAFSPSSTATYTVTGTDSHGCVNTNTVSVTVNPLPTVTGSVSPSSTVCAGTNITLKGSGALTYTWSGGETNGVAFVPSGNGSYTVTGTDGNGCMNSSFVNVTVNPLPNVTANVSPGYTVCTGSSVTLTGGGATSYSWSGGVNNGSAFSPASTTTYTVTGTDFNGCMNTSTAAITVDPLPTVTASASPTGAICHGADVTLTGGGAVSYTWSSGVNDGVPFSPAANATYTVTGYDANNCTNTATISVAVNPSPTVAVNVTGLTQTICQGDTMGIIASGANSYKWKPSAGLNATTTSHVIASPSVTTTYMAVGSNVIGCSDSAAITITVNPAPPVKIVGHDTILEGNTDTLIASGASSFIWQTGSYRDTIAVSPTVTTTYTVSGIDSDGCKSTGSFVVVVDLTTSIDNVGNSNNATVFPNPATETIYLSCKVSSGTSALVAVHDMTGREINSQSVTLNNDKLLPIDISNLTEGIYFIKLSASGKEYVFKFIKE